jgi:hypothetical protein
MSRPLLLTLRWLCPHCKQRHAAVLNVRETATDATEKRFQMGGSPIRCGKCREWCDRTTVTLEWSKQTADAERRQ